MIYRIYPSKDTTIYEDSVRKNQNTGKDEILEIGKFYDTDNLTLLGNSRALIEFDLTSISSSIVNGDITSPEYRLRLENIQHDGIQSDYDLYVFPVRDTWSEGVGSEVDTPHNELDSTWVNCVSGSVWDTDNSTIGKAPSSNVGGLVAYYDFIANAGDFELVEQIKGVDGTYPELNVVSGALQLSASMFGGGTANLSASMYAGTTYNLYFESTVGSLNGIDFRIWEPDGNGDATTEGTYIEKQSITTDGTHSIQFDGRISGVHLIQFTFFDTNGSNGLVGSLDNVVLYKTVNDGVAVYDEYNINGIASPYIASEPIVGALGETSSFQVENNKLFFSSSNYSGITAYRPFTAISGCWYTASFDLDLGNYPSFRYGIQDPNGVMLVDEDYSSNGTHTDYFKAETDDTYYLTYTVAAPGEVTFTGSVDNSIIQTDPTTIPPSRYTTLYYDAHWSKNVGGGTWYTSSYISGSHYSQSFTKYTSNLDVEITDYVDEWLDGIRPNNGLIIKKSKTDEQSTTKFGSIKFFSSDTHTIYPPTLEVRWDDSSWSVGDLSPLTSEDIILYVKGLGTEYKETSKAKIRVYGRDRFPARSFSDSLIKEVKHLPTTAYYSVVDSETNQVVIPFDTNYTKISCDSTSNYFNFWFNGLQPERFYKFIFRVDMNGTTKYYDDNFYFKVVR